MKTTYKVQTRKDGWSYETRLTTTNETQAHLIYNGYNMGYRFTKRLTADGKTIAKFKGA